MSRSEPRAAVVAYIGLGANLGNPIATLRAARRELGSAAGIRELAFSRLYRSAPMGPSDQPDYVNAAMAVETTLTPFELLAVLQSIEAVHGRVRTGERWGPRTLDLDLVLYGDETIESPTLTVPHPGAASRAFVLVPLQDIAPHLSIPGQGRVVDLLEQCPRAGLRVIEDG